MKITGPPEIPNKYGDEDGASNDTALAHLKTYCMVIYAKIEEPSAPRPPPLPMYVTVTRHTVGILMPGVGVVRDGGRGTPGHAPSVAPSCASLAAELIFIENKDTHEFSECE